MERLDTKPKMPYDSKLYQNLSDLHDKEVNIL